MSGLDGLAACAGRWAGTSTLHVPETGTRDESPSTVVVTPLLGGRFIRLDYTWAYEGAPQEGSLLVGFDSSQDEATAYWIDNWHMGEAAMLSGGTVDASGRVAVRGSWGPPEQPWGWRTEVIPGEGELRLEMYVITPDGQEEVAVEADYRKES